MTPIGGAFALRIDVGTTVGHSDGLQPDWVADQPYSQGNYGYTVGGQSFISVDAVLGTSDPSLYQSFRQGSALEYFVRVPNGNYRITLHFCDFISTGAGQNVFSATAQGQLVLNNLDVFAAAGGKGRALTRIFDVNVSAGVILLQMAHVQGYCLLSAIEVRGLQQQFPLTIRLFQPSNAVLLP